MKEEYFESQTRWLYTIQDVLEYKRDQKREHFLEECRKEILNDTPICPGCNGELDLFDCIMTYDKGFAVLTCVCGYEVGYRSSE